MEILIRYFKGLRAFIEIALIVGVFLLPGLILFNFLSPWHDAVKLTESSFGNQLHLCISLSSKTVKVDGDFERQHRRGYILLPKSLQDLSIVYAKQHGDRSIELGESSIAFFISMAIYLSMLAYLLRCGLSRLKSGELWREIAMRRESNVQANP